MNKVLAALVPPAVATRTLAVPGVPAGVVQVTAEAVLALSDVQALPPTVTPVALAKLVPEIITLVPPNLEPLLGVIEVTVGAGGK